MRIAMLLTLTFGCHAKFAKVAPELDTSTLSIQFNGPPMVSLGSSSDEGLIGAISNTVQAVRSMDQTARIQQAIQPDDVQAALRSGIANGLKDGIPFTIVEDESADAIARINVRRYGMFVDNIGDPGRFDFVAKLRVYGKDRKRVYGKRLRCSAGVGSPNMAAEILQVVNNVKQLKSMSDEQINQTFVDIAAYCGSLFTLKMQRHAKEY